MEVWKDLGPAVRGAWIGGGYLTRDPETGQEWVWLAEFSQEGSVLVGFDPDSGQERERHAIGCREFSAVSDPETGRLYITTYHGLGLPGNLLLVWDPRTRRLESKGFPMTPSVNRFVGAVLGQGRLWAGTHPDAHLVSFDPATDTWQDHGSLAPPPIVPGQHIWLRSLTVAPDGEILGVIARTPPHPTVGHHPATGQTRVLTDFPADAVLRSGDCFYANERPGVAVYDGDLRRRELLTLTALTVEPAGAYAAESAFTVAAPDGRGGLYGWCGGDVVHLDPVRRVLRRVASPAHRGTLLVSPGGRLIVVAVDAHAGQHRCTVIDPATGAAREQPLHYEGCKHTDIVGLARGADGSIYGTNIIGMHLFRFDPRARLLTDLGRVGWGGAEIYNLIDHGGKLYMGSYGGAIWAVYDPQRPWNPRPDTGGTAEDANPRCLGPLGDDQNRPFEYVVGPDARLYIACRSNYGLAGGGLVRFDPATGEKRVFRDRDQSVQAVTADARYIYGGTSIRGGRGWAETTTEGRLFVFDPTGERRLFETVPIRGAIAVTSLAASPRTGCVYGSTDTGHLFAFDPGERQVVQTWELGHRGTALRGVPEGYGMIHLTAGSDGNIYGVAYDVIFQLELSTDRVHVLDRSPIPDLYQIVEGEAGVFYTGGRGHLLEYRLKNLAHYR